MVSFNNRINSNQPHRYQREKAGDRDAQSQNYYTPQKKRKRSNNNDLAVTEDDFKKPISFLDKKEDVSIYDANNTPSRIDPNLSLNDELKTLINTINSSKLDIVNIEYLNDLLNNFSKLNNTSKQLEIIRLLQTICKKTHTVTFQKFLVKQLLQLLHYNPTFSEQILKCILSLHETQKNILKKLKYHSIYASEYASILDLNETQSKVILEFFNHENELPLISLNLLEQLSELFLSVFYSEINNEEFISINALNKLLMHSIKSSTTRDHLNIFLKIFIQFKLILKREKKIKKQSKIKQILSMLFYPSKPINVIKKSIKITRNILDNL